MKTVVLFVASGLLMLSCGTTKNVVAPTEELSRNKTTNLEGQQVMSETVKLSGTEMADALNDDGTGLVQRPYKWFAGIGKNENKQVAVEIAQREAYATISRVLNNAVYDEAKQNDVVVNEKVQQSLTAHWDQVSSSLQKACEPYGNTIIEYNPSTRTYEATAKVGIRGDRFLQLLSTAGSFKPSDLKGEELEQFIQTNKAIMEAARGN